jgi:VWFA-related protein
MRSIAIAVCVAALAAPSSRAQQPIFRSGVDLVRFDVRVTDTSGRPITDLRRDELQIVEDGRVLPLLLFQHLQEPAGNYADAALRSVSAEVSSNRGAPRGHLYLLVFDQPHITPGNEQVARRAAETFIRTRVRASDRVAVVGIPGPGPELGFTADRTRAAAELTKVRGDLERNVKSAAGNISLQEAYEIVSGNDRVTADVLARQSVDLTADVGAAAAAGMSGLVDRAASRQGESPTVMRKVILENARTVVAQADATTRDVLQRLADLVAQYRVVEGRKTVVLFSEGFHQANVSRELEQVAAAAAQSYAVFYAFDLNRRASSDISQQQLPATTAAAEIHARTEPLGSLAAETDGALVIDAASHLDAALDRIADQAQDYYLVGFTPSAAALDARGAYRRVSVRVSRPGARVSARTGYATPKAPGTLDRRRSIDAALAAPFAQQGLRLEYTTYTMRSDNAGRARVILSLEADLPVRDETHTAADVVFVVRDARDGRVVASGTDTMALPAAASQGAATGAGTFRVHFDIPPGAYLMRAVVREPGGLLGSADRRLDVRGLTGPDVTVSDVILESAAGGSLPVRARACIDDGLAGMVEAYGRSPAQLAPLDAAVTLVRASGEIVATVRAAPDETMSTGTGVRRRLNFSLPLAAVAPGSYVARVTVRSASETIADLSREVEVVEGSAFAAVDAPGRFGGTSPPGSASASAAVDPSRGFGGTRPTADGATAQMVTIRPADILGGDFVRTARAAMRGSTTPAAVHAVKGVDLFERSRFADAAGELAESMRLDQSSAAVAFVLGWAYEGAGRRREAIGAWRGAAAIDPKMVPAHLALADAYLRMSEKALAAQALRAGLAVLPGSAELQAKLADIEGK